MSKPDTHVVLTRPQATGRWEILEYATSAKSALAKARKQRDGLSRGDLILALDLAEVSVIQERGKCLYFVNKAGVITKAPKSRSQPTWFLEWEGPEADAYIMLDIGSKVDRKLVVTTACAIARLALPYVPAGENRPRIAIEMAEAWTRGEVRIEQVKKARDAAYAAAYAADDAAYAAANAANAASAASDAANAASAAANTSGAMPGDYEDNMRQLSHIVREYIPLHVVLESLT